MAIHVSGAASALERNARSVRILCAARLAAGLFGALSAGALGCSDDDDDEPATIAGSSGTITVLGEGFSTPTTVAVRGDTAWVPEGQFTHLPALGGTTPPEPFAVRSIALDGDGVLATSIDLPGDDFYPEGIATDPDSGDLYVASVYTGEIVKIESGSSTAERFVAPAPATLERGGFGLRVDTARRLLWACDSNLGASPALPGGTLVGLDLDDAGVVVRHELPEGSICNDIAIDANGGLYVTETAAGAVYYIDPDDVLTPDSAERWLSAPEIAPPMPGALGANGIALTGGRMFIANTSAGTLIRVDPGAADPASTASVVRLTDGSSSTALVLSGPDGVLPLSDTELLVVENGFAGPGNNRLLRVTLDPE
jgi:DNA-binding beta-propeller fold protein YncE